MSAAGFQFDTSYARLPEAFFVKTPPMPVAAARMTLFNEALARDLGLDTEVLSSPEGAKFLTGNRVAGGSEPLAMAYAGHQFGHFNMLGDGRAVLLGEHIAPDKRRVDIQLKGSGQTPFSRRGDGRAALGPMLREYIISEAMHALAIPTTRALAVVATGEMVAREKLFPGAVLTRIAASHIRCGTFEYAARLGDPDLLRQLADYTIARHYPAGMEAENPYLAFLEAVADRQASLISQWMTVGFIHGVMNTDNMAISGETIDYGPCAFMDRYHPATVFSSIDQQGRYAYGNQPRIAQWNLARFAETLLPLLSAEMGKAVSAAETVIDGFRERYKDYHLAGMRAKLGLFNREAEDWQLVEQLLQCLADNRVDYTLSLRHLDDAERLPALRQSPDFSAWTARWQARLARQTESLEQAQTLRNASNPVAIARNHQVEAALSAAVEHDDFAPMQLLNARLAKPYKAMDEDDFALPPGNEECAGYQTFCGT